MVQKLDMNLKPGLPLIHESPSSSSGFSLFSRRDWMRISTVPSLSSQKCNRKVERDIAQKGFEE